MKVIATWQLSRGAQNPKDLESELPLQSHVPLGWLLILSVSQFSHLFNWNQGLLP